MMKTSPDTNRAELELLLESAVLAAKSELPPAPFGFASATLALFREQRARQAQLNRVLVNIWAFAGFVSCVCFVLPANSDSSDTSASLFSTESWVQQGDLVEQYYDELASN